MNATLARLTRPLSAGGLPLKGEVAVPFHGTAGGSILPPTTCLMQSQGTVLASGGREPTVGRSNSGLTPAARQASSLTPHEPSTSHLHQTPAPGSRLPHTDALDSPLLRLTGSLRASRRLAVTGMCSAKIA